MNIQPYKAGIIAASLCIATAAGIAGYPLLQQAQAIQTPPGIEVANPQNHRIEVVFVLDTTSSMSGLIGAAKEKIWSIASSMASAQQSPDIRMGLVAFRDRGDAYITRVHDLSDDLDQMYASLMDFRAQGGGDGPESVNQALYDAIHKISWPQEADIYRVVFLVGDAPPHMDYPDDVRYPATLAEAQRRGIVVNTIQSGRHEYTRPAWQQIAVLGQGEYFQVEDSGNAVAVATPYDERMAQLAEELEATRLYYGDAEARANQERKLEASKKLREELSTEALARRSAYNATASGKANLLGNNELVDAVTSGRVNLEDIEEEDLPTSFYDVLPARRIEVIREKAERRDAIQQEIEELAESRQQHIREQLEAEGGAGDSLDEKIFRTVKDQAAEIGLSYDDDGARY